MEVATIGVIISAIKAAYDILKDVRSRNRVDPQIRRNALNSLYVAATETAGYIEDLRSQGKQARAKERELSELWRIAAGELYSFNEELSNRLLLKADYWLNPEQWSDEQVTEARIKLSDIRQEALNMILNK